METAVTVYQEAKTDKNEKVKAACEDYFKRAFITSGVDRPMIYRTVQTQPELVNLFLDHAIEAWKGNQNKRLIERQLQIIFDELSNEDDYFAFVSPYLEKMAAHQQDSEVFTGLSTLFDSLTLQQVEVLVCLLIKYERKPFQSLEILKAIFISQESNYRKLFGLCLTELPPSDRLYKFLEGSFSDAKFILGLSKDELEGLIRLWKAHLIQKDLFEKLKVLFETRDDTDQFFEICENMGIDLDAFAITIETAKLKRKFCNVYTLHALISGEPDATKISKIKSALSLSDVTEFSNFGFLLATICPTDQLTFLISQLPNLTSQSHLIAESLLRKLLKDTNMLRIQKAFEGFWTCWTRFEDELTVFDEPPNLAIKLLPEIKTEAQLEAVYRAIPQSAPDRAKIKLFLKIVQVVQTKSGSQKYSIPLAKDVIDCIVV